MFLSAVWGGGFSLVLGDCYREDESLGLWGKWFLCQREGKGSSCLVLGEGKMSGTGGCGLVFWLRRRGQESGRERGKWRGIEKTENGRGRDVWLASVWETKLPLQFFGWGQPAMGDDSGEVVCREEKSLVGGG